MISAVTNSSNPHSTGEQLSLVSSSARAVDVAGKGGKVGYEARDLGIGQGPGSGWHGLECGTQCHVPVPIEPSESAVASKGCSQFTTFLSDLLLCLRSPHKHMEPNQP